MSDPIKVLIVEDSPTISNLLSNIIKTDAGLQLIGVAKDGSEAVRMTARLRPQVITMDVNMPHMNGLEATEYIMAHYPTPILVLTASLAKQDVNLGLKMLSAGALEIMEKPAAEEWQQASQHLLDRIKLISRIKVITHLRGKQRFTPPEVEQPAPTPPTPSPLERQQYWRENAPTAPLNPAKLAKLKPQVRKDALATPLPTVQDYTLIAIAASTGGPPALSKLLKDLPAAMPVPIFVVQHIPVGFGTGLAEWLNGETALRVKNAEEFEKPLAGTVYLPADDTHLTVNLDGTLHLNRDPARFGLRPSADVTFESLAEAWPGKTLAIILTGMGRDGTAGMRLLKQAGSYNIAQDEASSVIFGMPKSAIEAQVVDKVLSLDAIAPFLKTTFLKTSN